MNRQEILTKAIKKAITGGWKGYDPMTDGWSAYSTIYVHEAIEGSVDAPPFYMNIIFNHDFAEALWGETDHQIVKINPNFSDDEFYLFTSGWKCHLQQMVITEDPIKYLGENI